MDCSICGKPVLETQSSIDHIKPGRSGGLNHITVHMWCNYRRLTLKQRMLRRIGYWRYKVIMWLDRHGR
jgi:hypothetical protein